MHPWAPRSMGGLGTSGLPHSKVTEESDSQPWAMEITSALATRARQLCWPVALALTGQKGSQSLGPMWLGAPVTPGPLPVPPLSACLPRDKGSQRAQLKMNPS